MMPLEKINRHRFGTWWQEDQFDGAKAFDSMRGEFERAVAANPNELCESFFIFAGKTVQMRVLGRKLAKSIWRPFAHLQCHRGELSPELVIELWDDAKTVGGGGTGPSAIDGGWHERTLTSPDNRFIAQQLPHTFSCLDRESNYIVGSIAWHEQIFIYERAKPLARLLLNWHNDQDIQMIHTGLVALEGQGLLLAGKSGSGKSTSTLACVKHGFEYLAEDYVGLEERCDGTYFGHSVYNSIFLKTDQLGRFKELAPYAVRGRMPHEEKSVVILSDIFPERLSRAATIRALILPNVIDSPDAELLPVSKGEALLALGPSSLLQIPNRGLGIRGFQALAQLVERVPCYRMRVGSNLPSIPQRMEELLTRVMAA